MNRIMQGWLRFGIIAVVVGLTFGVVRFSRFGGKAAGGDVPAGCGGPVEEGLGAPTVGEIHSAVNSATGKLASWNSCYTDTNQCVDQWGTYWYGCYGTGVSGYGDWATAAITEVPGVRCKSICKTTTCPHGCMGNYEWETSVWGVGAMYQCQTGTPSATNLSTSLSTNSVTGSFTFSQSYGGTNSSALVWYRADDSSGTNQTTIETASATTSLSHTVSVSDTKKFARFCVTPATAASTTEGGNATGSQQCTGWISLDIPSASSVSVRYSGDDAVPSYTYKDPLNKSESGSTYQWYWSFDGTQEIGGVQSTSKSWSISGAIGLFYAQVCVTPSNGSTTGTRVCSAFAKVGTPAATSVLATIASGVATGAWVFSDSQITEYSLSSYGWSRAVDSSGTGKTGIANASATTHTLVTADRGKYLQFCVTPANCNGAQGTQVCSTGVWVGPSVSNVYTTYGGGQWLGNYSFTDNYTGAAESGTTYQWYGGSLADGSDVTVLAGQINRWLNATDGAGYTYVFYCVTPSDGTTGGPAQCSHPGSNAWNVAISGTAQTGSTLTGSYGFTCGTTSALSESGSTYQWYTVASDGTATAISGATSKTYTLGVSQGGLQVEFCVIPKSASSTGSETCSAAVTVLPTITWYADNGYSGTTVARSYAFGDCVNMSDLSMDNMASSVKFYGQPAADAKLTYYLDADCAGTSGAITATAATNGSVSAFSLLQVNDLISSFRMAWATPPSASSVAIAISGQSITGTYLYSGDLAESGSTLQIQRANDASGTSATSLTSSSSYTITTSEEEKYVRYCVTPANANGSGTQVCSSWTSVGHLVQLWKDESYSGTNINIAYEKSSSGSCFNLTDYSFNDVTSSLKYYGIATTPSTLWVYRDINCSGTNATYTLAAAGSELTPSMTSRYGSGWNDSLTSFRVTW